jgi:hypothetical protein
MRDELDKRHFGRHNQLSGDFSLPNLQSAPREERMRDPSGLGGFEINGAIKETTPNNDLDFINQISKPMVSKKYIQRNTLDYNNIMQPQRESSSSSSSSFQESFPNQVSDRFIVRKEKDDNETIKVMQTALDKQSELLSKLITSMGSQKNSSESESDVALKVKLQELEKNNQFKDEIESLKQQMMLQQMFHGKRDEKRVERNTNINRMQPHAQSNLFNK